MLPSNDPSQDSSNDTPHDDTTNAAVPGPQSLHEDLAKLESAVPDDPAPNTTAALEASPALTSKKAFSWSLVGIILGIGLAVYMIVVPAISMFLGSLSPQPVTRLMTDMTLLEYIRLHAVSGIVMLLFLATGASIGSFLNVVIYRLPRGKPLLRPPSSCPNCGYKIRGRDNLPILAWIGLRGRCRQCHVAISMRYPIIEFIVASVFVLLYYIELLSGGGNLPIREPNIYNGIVWILLYTKWDLVSIYFLHTIMLTALLAWGMINFDLFRVPKITGIVLVVLAAVCVVLFPHLNPTSKTTVLAGLSPSLATTLAGLLVGGISGFALQLLFRQPKVIQSDHAEAGSSADATDAASENSTATNDLAQAVPHDDELASDSANLPELVVDSSPSFKPQELYGAAANQPAHTTDALLSMLLIGVVLGPTATLSISFLTLVFAALWLLTRKILRFLPSVPVTLQIFIVATIQVALWRQSSWIPIPWWPKPDSSLVLVLAWGGVLILTIAAGLGLRHLRSRSNAVRIN